MDSEALVDLYAEYSKPYLTKLQKLLKVDKVYTWAQGNELRAGSESVIDFLGGYGSTLAGHNHPEILKLVRTAIDQNLPSHAQGSVRAYSGLLGRKVNELFRKGFDACDPDEKFLVHLCNTGTEAVEAAIKHALMQHAARLDVALRTLRRERVRASGNRIIAIDRAIETLRSAAPVLIALKGSYHGKTAGSIAATFNAEFRRMYPESAIRVVFLDPRSAAGSADWDLELQKLILPAPAPGLPDWCPVAGIIFEPIQGEGGIEPLPDSFFRWMEGARARHGMPLIADEIQCGMFRTGTFLACEAWRFRPDYFLLGKSLGGGVAKISALAIRESCYQNDFSWVHSSTFAEDELSSQVALRTLELLEAAGMQENASRFEAKFRAGLRSIEAECPGLFREVRGKGFLLGIEFDFTGARGPMPHFLKTVHDTGFASYLVMSYLLNQHGLRVGVTLSRSDVIRIQPSAWIGDQDTVRLIEGLRELARLVRDRKMLKLTSHLWRDRFTPEQLELVSPPVVRVSDEERKGIRTIAFVSHLIDRSNLLRLDPLFSELSESERNRFLRKFGEVAGPCQYHEQIIEGANGQKVFVKIFGSFRLTEFFESCMRDPSPASFAGIEAVEELVRSAVEHGADLVGLGQYTSIVSENGMLLDQFPVGLTTGNSLTAGFAFKALEKALAERGKTLEDCRIGVVGAAGNICNVIAQLLADRAKHLTLIHREGEEAAGRMKAAALAIASKSKLSAADTRLSADLADLRGCDAVLIGTNTAKQIILPEHLKEGAVLVDISVPSNVDSRVFKERPDVRAFHGGLARLPFSQKLSTVWMPLPPGQVFACLGETLAIALDGHIGHYSFGPLTKERVQHALETAEKVGITLGSLIPLQTRL